MIPTSTQKKNRMPVLFAGHGSPVNAFTDNKWSRGFAALSAGFEKPRAILAISAHWYVNGSWLTGGAQPRTIHDFYGFPRHMYEVNYKAPGSVDLATRVQGLLDKHDSELKHDWGLDHGTWSVLRHAYPDASVPVVQLSIDRRMSPAQIHQMAASLKELRYDGVLIFTSGNLTHNLKDALKRMATPKAETPGWARRFDGAVVDALKQRDTKRLVHLWPDTEDGRIAHPSADHWLPLIYAHGVTDNDDTVHFPIDGFDGGSLSMRSILFT